MNITAIGVDGKLGEWRPFGEYNVLTGKIQIASRYFIRR
jgi:hypothetical protein